MCRTYSNPKCKIGPILVRSESMKSTPTIGEGSLNGSAYIRHRHMNFVEVHSVPTKIEPNPKIKETKNYLKCLTHA